MPTSRVRRPLLPHIDVHRLDADQRRELLEGSTFASDGSSGFRGDGDAFKRAWQIHGPRLLAGFVAEHPGFRPFGWWFAEHGHERPILHPGAFTDNVLATFRRYGFLHTSLLRDPTDPRTEFQQPEPLYLNEHNLLQPGEQERYQDQFEQHEDEREADTAALIRRGRRVQPFRRQAPLI